MTQGLKFGLNLPIRRIQEGREGPASDVILALVRRAEELGYDAVATGDHIVTPDHWLSTAGEAWYDPFALLGFITAVTHRLRLLTDVVALPYRNPFTIAKAVASLDQLSRGRVIFGAGSGFLEAEFSALGIPFQERGPRTDEYLRIIKELWTKEAPSFQGRYYSFSGVRLSPRPLQKPHPPIWIGGSSRRAVQRAVEMGDGWAPFSATPQEVREALAYADGLMRGWRIHTRLDVAVHLTQVELRSKRRDRGGRALTGVADQIGEDIAAYKEAGATYAIVGFGGRTLHEFREHMEAFAAQVMPAFL
ncbi:MAG: LLM class F420-dependent oxidoreductase [Chloroflexi bacterium]|nr:LLM class F420-dependent oxidoreductase [Chloroflexota bacterium]